MNSINTLVKELSRIELYYEKSHELLNLLETEHITSTVYIQRMRELDDEFGMSYQSNKPLPKIVGKISLNELNIQPTSIEENAEFDWAMYEQANDCELPETDQEYMIRVIMQQIEGIREEMENQPKPAMSLSSSEDMDDAYQEKLEYNWWMDEKAEEIRELERRLTKWREEGHE